MARIRSIRQGSVGTKIHRTETDAEVRVIIPGGGEKLIQIRTFGSDDRKEVGTSSQTIQIGVDAAKWLRELIDATFGTD